MSDPSRQYDQTDADNYYLAEENRRLRKDRDKLRAALVGIIGMDGRQGLETLEATLRLMAAPMEDKAASIDGIHALLSTLLDEPLAADAVDPSAASTGKTATRVKAFSSDPAAVSSPEGAERPT